MGGQKSINRGIKGTQGALASPLSLHPLEVSAWLRRGDACLMVYDIEFKKISSE